MSPVNPIRSIIENAAPIKAQLPPAVEPKPVAQSVDYSVLSEGRREAPKLPLELFGLAWAKWIQEAAESKGCPPDYVAAAVLAVAGVAIGNARWPQPWHGWQEPPVLWLANIGGSSSGKSPGMEAVTDLCKVLEEEYAAGFPDLLREYQTKFEAAKCAKAAWQSEVKDAVSNGAAPPQMPEAAVEPERPARPRIVFGDATQEEIGALQAATAKGLLLFRDELTGWLLNFDKYGGGGERSYWLEAYGGRPYVIDRRKFEGNPIRIPHNSLGVLGGITPDKLASGLMSGDDDGLSARILCVWPDPLPWKRPTVIPQPDFAVAAFRRLRGLGMAVTEHGTPTYQVTPLADDAANLVNEWREKHAAEAKNLSGRYASHLGKFPGMLIRLALLLEHLWWCAAPSAEPATISRIAVAASAALLDDYFKPMAERAYGDAAVPEPERHAAAIAKWIMSERPATVNPRELRHKRGLPGLRETGQVKAALDVLIDAGWLEAPPSGIGHRGRNDYVVRPAVYRGYA